MMNQGYNNMQTVHLTAVNVDKCTLPAGTSHLVRLDKQFPHTHLTSPLVQCQRLVPSCEIAMALAQPRRHPPDAEITAVAAAISFS